MTLPGVEASARLWDFLLGYVVVLATPGPNLLAIGGVAALRGMRGALPVCFGIALGAGVLSAGIAATIGASGVSAAWDDGCRLLGAGLLLWVAWMVARSRPPDPASVQGQAARTAEFGAAFCTAATNPLTAAFIAAQFLGPLSAGGSLRVVVPLSVVMVALAYFLAVARLFAHPAFRGAVLAWHRPIRLVAAVALVLMAVSIATPVLD